MMASGAVEVFRTLYCGTLATQVAFRFQAQSAFFRSEPSRIYGGMPKLLGLARLQRPGYTQFQLAGVAFALGLAAAALGIAPKVGLGVALLAFFIYFPPILGLGSVMRKANLVPLVLGILLLAPSNQLLGVQIAVAAVYFSAGIAKLQVSGWRWMDGVALQGYFVTAYMWHERPLALWLSRSRSLCALLSTVVLIWELTFPVAIFFPSMVWVWVVVGVGFHLATSLLMRIHYWVYFGPVYFVFVAPWVAQCVA